MTAHRLVHVVHRFAVGGLENGLVNLINRLPLRSWRHVVVSLTDIDPSFAQRVIRDDVEYVALRKGPGHALRLYPRMFELFRRLRPAIVHTRNLAALEACVPAWAAGVPVRLHGEHGRDVDDLDGSSGRGRWVRKAFRPFVTHYVAVSPDLEDYARKRIGIPAGRIDQIYNGVDTERFRPRGEQGSRAGDCPFREDGLWLVGTVGRIEAVKDQATLARAFIRAVDLLPEARQRLRLVIVGGGRLRGELELILEKAGLRELAWFPGERSDVPELLASLDCFVLPSLAEGVSNTVLEAMACALPVIATRVGANAELIVDATTGRLIPVSDCDALAREILAYFRDPETARAHGRAGRDRVERVFSLQRMVERYHRLYSDLAQRALPEASSPAQALPEPGAKD